MTPHDANAFDYVIVGAGSAGCVLAHRLSASGRHRVLLLEAGGKDDWLWIRGPVGYLYCMGNVPLGFGKLFTNPQVNWLYMSEPEPECGDRRIIQPRGKVLGGSSSINGLLYVRGQAEDYDRWRQLGNPGWSFADVLPYFRKAEDQQRGSSDFHGVNGPLAVSDTEAHPLCEAFLEAARQAGHVLNDDFNGETQEGFGYYQVTTRNGRRCSTAVGYLKPARRRANLAVVSNALATRILFDGRHASGVAYFQGDQAHTARARAEVIVAGGAINSPQLLQLSGLGPASLLRSFGINLIADMPGIGADLQDHYLVRMAYRCTEPLTLNDIVGSWPRSIVAGLRYGLFRRGILSAGAAVAGGGQGNSDG